MWQDRDSHVGHRNDIGRGGSGFLSSLQHARQGLIVVRKDNSGAEGTHDEEETEAVVDRLECVLDVNPWAFGLCCHHGDVLRSDDTECSAPHASQESLKSTETAGREILGKSARVVPVTESVCISLWIAANHRHECEAKQHEDQDDLAARKPEFSFAISPDCKHVEETVCEVSIAFLSWALMDKALRGLLLVGIVEKLARRLLGGSQGSRRMGRRNGKGSGERAPVGGG